MNECDECVCVCVFWETQEKLKLCRRLYPLFDKSYVHVQRIHVGLVPSSSGQVVFEEDGLHEGTEGGVVAPVYVWKEVVHGLVVESYADVVTDRAVVGVVPLSGHALGNCPFSSSVVVVHAW